MSAHRNVTIENSKTSKNCMDYKKSFLIIIVLWKQSTLFKNKNFKNCMKVKNIFLVFQHLLYLENKGPGLEIKLSPPRPFVTFVTYCNNV